MPNKNFVITTELKSYNCYSTINGTNVLNQTITVLGVGSDSDNRSYNRNEISLMDSIAKTIANIIISKHESKIN